MGGLNGDEKENVLNYLVRMEEKIEKKKKLIT